MRVWTAALGVVCSVATVAGMAQAGSVTVHKSGRYFQDASGKPIFFIGYYSWASVAPGYYIDSPQRYADMIEQGARYKLNYVRFSLGINAMGGKGTKYYELMPNPTPFVYVNGKADLDQWNTVFWDGLRYHADLAKRNGVLLHVCLFDGVDIRGGNEEHRWINSYWNVHNQVRDFYGDLDTNGDGNADEKGEFYRADDFKADRGVGLYQRKLIDKAIEVTARFDNVFFEIGNEMLSSSADWNTAVIDYVRSKTKKAITQNGGRLVEGADGWSEHDPDTPADVKKTLAERVGKGCPFWEDPDGSKLMHASPDDLRRAAWYSFAGGAAGWGGFGHRYWSQKPVDEVGAYFRRLVEFIEASGVKFSELLPHHELVTNPSLNSCLASPGKEYVAYVANDPNVTVDLAAIKGKAVCRIYDPKTGAWQDEATVAAAEKHTFTRPPGADDWAIYIRGERK